MKSKRRVIKFVSKDEEDIDEEKVNIEYKKEKIFFISECINLKNNYLERDKYRSIDYISYEDAFKQKFEYNNFACNILFKKAFDLLKNYDVAFTSGRAGGLDYSNYVYFVDDKINISCELGINMMHQLAHIIEMEDNNKLLKDNFGLPVFFLHDEKKPSDEALLKAFVRESKVRGIQRHFGDKPKYFLDYEKPSFPFAKFESYSEFTDWQLKIMQTSYYEYSEEKILAKLKEKLDFIQSKLNNKRCKKYDFKCNYKSN